MVEEAPEVVAVEVAAAEGLEEEADAVVVALDKFAAGHAAAQGMAVK